MPNRAASAETELQGRGRRGSDAELTDQGVGHAGPGLGADGRVDRVLAIELAQ